MGLTFSEVSGFQHSLNGREGFLEDRGALSFRGNKVYRKVNVITEIPAGEAAMWDLDQGLNSDDLFLASVEPVAANAEEKIIAGVNPFYQDTLATGLNYLQVEGPCRCSVYISGTVAAGDLLSVCDNGVLGVHTTAEEWSTMAFALEAGAAAADLDVWVYLCILSGIMGANSAGA